MSNVNVSVTIDIEVSQYDIDILIDMAGYGMGYWAVSATQDDESETYSVTYEDEEGNPDSVVTKVATFQALGEALVNTMTDRIYVARYAQQYVALKLAGDEYAAGEIDAALADVVVQKALFGEVIFG